MAAVPRPRARWATRLLIPAAVLLATGGILAYAARDAVRPRLEVHVAAAIPRGIAQAAPSGVAAQDVPESTLSTADAPLGPVAVQAPGWIEPDPFAISIPALAEGVVKEVLVLEGEQIESGQIVARLIDDDARLLLRAAEANVAERSSDVERAKAALATAESQVVVERIAADELRDEVAAKRGLVGAGGLSEGTFRRMEIRLGGLDAKVVTTERIVSEAKAAFAQAEAARETALVAKDEVLLRLARMEVRSPVSGVVLARLVEPGSRISMGSKSGEGAASGSMAGAVLRVYDPAKLQVRVDVPLADAAKVGVGTRATVTTEALADQTFTGIVSRVVHEANIQRNTVQFKVALDAPSPVLKPEMLTRVKLHAAAARALSRVGGATRGGGFPSGGGGDLTLLVPRAAVTAAGDGKGHVWVVDAGSGSPVARKREIATLPAADDGFIAVTGGLRLTDRVILDPPSPPAIQDGTRLKVLGERTSAASEPQPTNP
jgi:HlyD family secretion protein